VTASPARSSPGRRTVRAVLLVAAGAALVAVVALGGAASTEQRFRLAAPLLAAGLVVAALAELVALARVEWHRGNVPVRRYAVVLGRLGAALALAAWATR